MNPCHGCNSYGKVCTGNDSRNIQCPCVNCLVKGVCENSCEEFESFSDYMVKRNAVFSQQSTTLMKAGVI